MAVSPYWGSSVQCTHESLNTSMPCSVLDGFRLVLYIPMPNVVLDRRNIALDYWVIVGILDHPKKNLYNSKCKTSWQRIWPTHSASAHTRKHNTHTHTHTHTYVSTTQENAQKASTNMHSKQALSPIHEIWRFLWILDAKKLFVRASSSDSWRAICADDLKAKSCGLRLFHATDTNQTLAYVIHGAHPLLRRSWHFSVATM